MKNPPPVEVDDARVFAGRPTYDLIKHLGTTDPICVAKPYVSGEVLIYSAQIFPHGRYR